MARSLFWLSDEAWKTLEPHLPHGKPGKPRVDDRIVISGILHVLKTGCRWRDVPSAFGPPTTNLQPLQSLVPAPYLAAHFRENGGRRSSS
jgi:transposase